MLIIEGGRSCLYQWDVDQRLEVVNDEITEVDFVNAVTSPALVCEVYEEDGRRFADVPNVLLQQSWPIQAYGCCGSRVRDVVTCRVVRREKPADYVYTETEIKTFASLEEQIAANKKAIEELAKKNNETLPAETDPTVPDWAKQPTKPSYTAHEVGAYNMAEMDEALESVDESLGELDGAVYADVYGKNLVNPDTAVHGFLSDENGTIKTGDSNANYETSDFISVKPNTDYNLSMWNASANSRPTARKAVLLYDAAKSPIAGSYINQNNVAEIVFNTGAASYVRVSGQTYRFVEDAPYDRVLFLAEGSTFTTYEPYGVIGKQLRNAYPDTIFGKTWAVCGDSFTNGGYSSSDGFDESEYMFSDGPFAGKQITYPRIIASRNNMQLLKFFENGRTLANPADGTFKNSLTNPESIGYYQKIPANADYITIYLGVNDSHYENSESGGIPLGAIEDTDASTFCGAWNVVLPWLLTNRPNAHIGIIVANGVGRSEYRTATIAAAKKWGIPYLDLNGDERCPAMIRTVNPDVSDEAKTIIKRKWRITMTNTHPNTAAQYFQASFIENWLRTL